MSHRDQHREPNGRFKGRTGASYFRQRNPLDVWMRRWEGKEPGRDPSTSRGEITPSPVPPQPSNGDT